MKKSRFRIVPIVHPILGACWSLKENEMQVATFLKKQQAEVKKTELETKLLENFLLDVTSKQEIKIDL